MSNGEAEIKIPSDAEKRRKYSSQVGDKDEGGPTHTHSHEGGKHNDKLTQ